MGDKIAFYRSSKRYTQNYMAKKLGISQKCYSNIESNIKQPTEQELDIIAAELGVSKETLKSPSPIIIINDAQHNSNVGNNTIEHQQINIDKDLLKNIMLQITKKDEQIEKLLLQVERLLNIVNKEK